MSGDKGNPFVGTWKLESSENFEEYMKAVEVGYLMRKMGAVAKPNVTIAVNGDEWTMCSETTFKTTETKFKLGQEFEETTADGRKVMATFVLADDKKLEQKQIGGVPSTIIREVIDDGNTMVATCTAKDIKSTRIYKRAQ